jgi:NADH dehydrogenase
MVRNQARVPGWGSRPVEVRIGDALNLDSLQIACRDVDHVVSLVAVRRDHPQSLISVNADGPRLLGEAARLAGIKSVVLVSAVGASPTPRLRYLTSRWMGEQELRGSGVPTTVLRFSFILGNDGGVLSDFERAAKFGPILVLPGGGQTRLQPIVREDAAKCIALAIGREDLFGSSLDLGGPEVMTYQTLFNIFTRARGIRKPQLSIPIPLLLLAAHVMEAVMPNPLVVPDELRTLQTDNLGDGLDCIARDFGFRPLSPSLWAAEHWRPRPRAIAGARPRD